MFPDIKPKAENFGALIDLEEDDDNDQAMEDFLEKERNSKLQDPFQFNEPVKPAEEPEIEEQQKKNELDFLAAFPNHDSDKEEENEPPMKEDPINKMDN